MHDEQNAQLEKLQPLVRREVRRKLRGWPEHLREEVEQNVLIKLWERVLPQFDPARGPIEALAKTAIMNLITDELRKLQAQRPQFVLEPDEVAKEDDDHEDVKLAAALQNHPERYLPPYLLRVYRARVAHSTPGAAAESIGMDVDSFYTLSTKLKSYLRNLFRSEPAKRKAG